MKKQLKALINRFDAAQDAFVANTADVKKQKKKLKKKLAASRAEVESLHAKIDALKAEIDSLKEASNKPAPKRRGRKPGPKSGAKKTTGRRGRPRKTTTETPETTTKAAAEAKPKRRPGRPKGTAKRSPGRPKKTATKSSAGRPKTGSKGPGRPRKAKAPASPLQAIKGFGPTLARNFEAAGVNTPAKVAALSNAKMAEILANCGPRYRNATPEKMEAYRQAAKAAK